MTERLTNEAQGLFTVLRQSADPETVAEIEDFVAEATDRALCRVNTSSNAGVVSGCGPSSKVSANAPASVST